MREATARFLTAMEADGLAPKTVIWYEDKLDELTQLLSNSPPLPIEEVTVDDLRRALVALRKRGLSEHTIHGYVRTMKRFFGWCQAEGIITDNPALRIKKPRLPKEPPKAVDMDDVRRLLAVADDPRDRALVLVLVDTGCRAGEIMGLRVQDVDLEAGVARVRGKGDKSRAVALNPVTCDAIRTYLEVRPADKGDALWWGKRGALTGYGLRFMLDRLKKKAGITGRVNPHSFRHGFAREYLQASGDLATLAEILGHADPQVTVAYYSRFTRSELLDKQRRLSPVHQLEN